MTLSEAAVASDVFEAEETCICTDKALVRRSVCLRIQSSYLDLLLHDAVVKLRYALDNRSLTHPD